MMLGNERHQKYPMHEETDLNSQVQAPRGWTVSKVKYIGTYLNGYAFKPSDWDDDGVPIIRIQNLTDPGADFNYTALSVPEKYKVKIGDILISWSASLGVYVWNRDFEGWLNQHIFKVLPNEDQVDASFFPWLASWFINELEKDSHGSTMQHITWGKFGGFRVKLPSKTEQKLIASFLDREITKLDQLIEKKQRLIELLQEKRQALITQVVTKGLDSNVPMKDSGIEWLGEVPEHWNVTRNKALFYEFSDRNESEDVELLTVSHITGVTRRSEKNVNMFLAETFVGYKKCLPGDLVINTMWAWMGALGISPYEGVVSPSYNVYRLRDGAPLHPKYYDYLCRIPSHVITMKAFSTGVWESRLRLYPKVFLSLSTCLPPISEQETIVNYLDEQTRLIDKLIDKTQQSIDLYREYRQALISAAVTGQIDVRHYMESEAANVTC